MKKRISALLLCLVMSVSVLAGCAGSIDADSDYKGQQITMYLSDNVYNLDPAYAYTNEISRSIVNLLFDTLFTVDEKGKVSPSLAKSYRTEKTNDGEYFMYIEIREDAKWSDNNPVTADDVVYAWKRILNPNNSFESAALLLDIKNARKYNEAEVSKDDIGLTADGKLLTIQFEQEINYDQFLLNLTSLALAPLREDIASKNEDWAKKPGIMVASGPFKFTKVGYYTDAGTQYVDINYSEPKVDENNMIVKDKNGNSVYINGTEDKLFPAQSISSYMLERNLYYYRDAEDEEKLDVSVTPYRIIVDCSLSDEEILKAYNDGIITYVGDIPMSIRDEVTAHISDSLSTNVCYLNENADIERTLADGTKETVKLFDNETVRQVLSMAIDREAIADAVVYAEAATGLVPTGVYDADSIKTLFRDSVANYAYLSKKSVSDLKATLASEGIVPSEYTFTVTVSSYDEVHLYIANALAAAWGNGEGGLGFNVSVKVRGTIANNDVHKDVSSIPGDLCDDLWAEDIKYGKYDAAILDLVALSADPFSVLAPFATQFSGQAMDMSDSNNYKATPHITGYSSEAYDAILERAFTEKDVTKRASILHDAEAELMESMPVIPIVFNKSAYLLNDDLLDLNNKVLFWDKANEYYYPVFFDKMSIKDYEEYELSCAKYVFENYDEWKTRADSYFGITFKDVDKASFVYTNSNYYYLFKEKFGVEGYEFIPEKPASKGEEVSETGTEAAAD